MASRANRVDAERLGARLGAIYGTAGAELSGLAVAVVEGGELVHEACFGRRYIDSADRALDLPVEGDTKFRVASISKPVTALGAMTLVERGLLDLDRDISEYLGFAFRNPHYPDRPITCAMLLSHSSSVRDEGGYIIPLPHSLESFALHGLPGWGKLAWAAPIDGRDCSPGGYYCYANLNYGLLATAMERVSGERFDLFMRDHVLSPLGIDAAYNVNLLSDEGLRKLAALYRKAGEDEAWRPSGPWIAQVDDLHGRRVELPFRAEPGLTGAALEAYRVGTNGSIFSPQGGLRISVRDLAKILRLFLGGGEVDGFRLLSRESVARMTTRRWAWDGARRNGELFNGITRETGLGLARTTASRDEQGGDRLLPGGGPRLWGHHGDAYGLLGGLLFDPEEGYGFVYLIGGTASAPERRRGRYSSWFGWEEELHGALLEATGRGEIWRTALWRWRADSRELGCFSLDGLAAGPSGLILDPANATRRDGLVIGGATSPELPVDFPAYEAIPSWNADIPASSRLEVFLRARCRGVWTGWYALGQWCSGGELFVRRSVGGQEDEAGRVLTDTLALSAPAEAFQLCLELAMEDGAAPGGSAPAGSVAPGGPVAPAKPLPSLRNLALAVSERRLGAPRGRRERGDPSRHGRVVEGVPAFSQMVYADGGATWCSPTCVAMVLAYWKRSGAAGESAEAAVRRAVAGVYDVAWGGCGNWAFNAAYAGTQGCDALVARFPSLARLEAFTAAGIPVVMSVAWDEEAGRPLTGAPIARSAGHLTLLLGFDDNGDPVVNEPAAADPGGVRRRYRRDELEARWLESSGGAVYLIVPAGKALPGLP